MAAFIFDASGIVKRYLTEIGSGWVQGLTNPAAAHEILLTRITRVEIVAAITRRSCGGPVPATVAPALLAQFRHDAAHQYTILGRDHPLSGTKETSVAPSASRAWR